MLATRNFGDRHTVVDEVPWELGAEDNDGLLYSKLVLHSLCISRDRTR